MGSGKTGAILTHLSKTIDRPTLIVAPTLVLCHDIYRRCQLSFIESPEYTNGDRIRLIVEDAQLGPVYPRALAACHEIANAQPNILVLTTPTFMYLIKELTDETKSCFQVFIDEGLPEIEMETFSPENQETYLDYFDQSEDGFIKLRPGTREILEWVAYTPQRLAGHQLDHLSTDAFRKICGFVVSGNYDVHLTKTEHTLNFIGILSPEQLLSFRQVTLIVAIFEQTLLPVLWKQKHGIEFQRYEIDEVLYDTHTEKGPLLHIWHVLHEADNPSLVNLKRNAKTGERDETEWTNTVFFDAAKQIDEQFPNGAYCWAANNKFNYAQQVLTGQKMPAICAGLNDFRLYHTVVTLLCMNPPPWVKNAMMGIFLFEEDSFYELWRFAHTYQVVGRCAIRNRDANERLDVVVLSLRCAKQLNEIFSGSTIEGQITNLPRYSSERKDSSVIEEFGVHYTSNDNSAFSKYNARERKNDRQPMDKKQWFREKRLPALNRQG